MNVIEKTISTSTKNFSLHKYPAIVYTSELQGRRKTEAKREEAKKAKRCSDRNEDSSLITPC